MNKTVTSKPKQPANNGNARLRPCPADLAKVLNLLERLPSVDVLASTVSETDAKQLLTKCGIPFPGVGTYPALYEMARLSDLRKWMYRLASWAKENRLVEQGKLSKLGLAGIEPPLFDVQLVFSPDANGKLCLASEPAAVVRLLTGFDFDYLRSCERCGKLFWAGRYDKESCSECRNAVKAKNYRDRERAKNEELEAQRKAHSLKARNLWLKTRKK